MSEKRILIKEFTKSPCTGCSGAGETERTSFRREKK